LASGLREVGERDLRLDHPELDEVAAGVRVLRCSYRFSVKIRRPGIHHGARGVGS